MANNGIPTDLKTLERLFVKRRIATGEVAFYNDPAFVQMEQANPALLDLYAAWVRLRPRSTAYDGHVRRVVPKVAEIFQAEIARDGQKGVCIDASMTLMKMLEEEGIWCYCAKGAFHIEAPAMDVPTHFWMFDVTPAPGHTWVVAPPFEIVDITLQCQDYSHGEGTLLPPLVVAEAGSQFKVAAEDLFSGEFLRREFLRRGPIPRDIHLRLIPDLARTLPFFPSFEMASEKATLRYACGGVTVPDASSLYVIKNRTWNGRYGGQLFDEVIRPALCSE